MSKGRKGHHQAEDVEEEHRSPLEGGEPVQSEMFLMFKAMLAEQRQEERSREAFRMEEMKRMEEAREKKEAEMVAKQALLREEMETRQYQQQMALIRLQADLGKEATKTHRENQNKDRKRDRALLSVPILREGEDLEDFLVMMEGRMEEAGIEKEEWVSSISSKLTGRLASTWREITLATEDYEVARTRLLEGSGYTAVTAADKLFGFKQDQWKGLSAGELYHKGQQLARRMMAPNIQTPEQEFALLRGWIGTVIPKRARAALDGRVVTKASELIAALQDFLVLEGESGSGQTAVFRGRPNEGRTNESFKERGSSFNCFKCGRAGHKAADCWRGRAGSPKAGNETSGGVVRKIICHTCGEEGHKSPQCPRNARNEKGFNKDVKAKPVKRVWMSQPKCVLMDGRVNGHSTPILLDSGAAISIVPESMVGKDQKTGAIVAVKPFGASEPMLLPIASLPFIIGDLEWEETVAVAPLQDGVEEEVIYGLDLLSDRGLQLVSMANSGKPRQVYRVTTRAQAETELKEREKELEEEAEDGATASPLIGIEADVIEEDEELEETLGSKEEEMIDCLGIEEETLVDGNEEDVLMDEDLFELRQEVDETPELEVPSVRAGPGSRTALISETRSDPSLVQWRALAEKKEKGFLWENSLLYKTVTTHVMEVERLLVLPKSFRVRVMEVAHEKLNHMGSRRVLALLKQKFAWPGMGQEVIKHCRSCAVCQKCAKPRARQVPMMERKVLSEPFESMAFDLVGPIPKEKGGYRYLLTCVCMASRWPEAIPVRCMTASAVAQGMLDIFSRTGVPLRLLSDQGSQFVGKVITKLCQNLHIESIQSTPYHPEGNGVVERMHSTLGAMLTKAASQGLDWVGQVPFALFALRSAPNRDSGFSPFDLIYGRHVRTPLDILHQGWAQREFEQLDTDEWAQWLVERLECWHDVARERGECASSQRKKEFDKRSMDRVLEEGDMVLCRIPGAAAKLEESWHGPYEIMEKLNRVNFRVGVGRGRTKVLHINNLKKFWVREVEVSRMSVVAEDANEDMVVGLKLSGKCLDFDEKMVEVLRREFPKVFSDVPGKTEVCELTIRTGDSPPIASVPYRVPDRLKGVVKEEIDNLVELGVASPSHSPWASPIVPVTKKDGKIRLCVDYRKLNEVTTPDPYYMTTLDEILEKVGDSGCLSKLDLSKGFYQIGIEEGSRNKTAFISPFGKYSFSRMPFGLRNSPAVFQRTMEEVLRGCYHCSAPYIDDILVFSRNGIDHVDHLRQVLKALSEQGLTIKDGKCEFGRTRLEYLGHLIGEGQVAVPRHRATAMEQFIQPRTKKQLRSFLGAMSYYRRFILNYANYSAILSPSTSTSAPSVVDWSSQMLETFTHLKGVLVSVSVLTIPSQEDCFCIHTDASGAGVGATLNVVRKGVELPVAFYSKQLQGAEKRYSATELEGLAVFRAVNYFDHFLFGQKFTVYTDHKALVYLLKSKRLNRRLYGWLLKLQEFDMEIIYKPGKENADADALSRQAWSSEDGLGEECQPRTAAISFVGGDVGTSPTEKKKESRRRRTVDENH